MSCSAGPLGNMPLLGEDNDNEAGNRFVRNLTGSITFPFCGASMAVWPRQIVGACKFFWVWLLADAVILPLDNCAPGLHISFRKRTVEDLVILSIYRCSYFLSR